LSIATTRLFASPRLTASKPLTGTPFSVRRGVFDACVCVTTLRTTWG